MAADACGTVTLRVAGVRAGTCALLALCAAACEVAVLPPADPIYQGDGLVPLTIKCLNPTASMVHPAHVEGQAAAGVEAGGDATQEVVHGGAGCAAAQPGKAGTKGSMVVFAGPFAVAAGAAPNGVKLRLIECRGRLFWSVDAHVDAALTLPWSPISEQETPSTWASTLQMRPSAVPPP